MNQVAKSDNNKSNLSNSMTSNKKKSILEYLNEYGERISLLKSQI